MSDINLLQSLKLHKKKEQGHKLKTFLILLPLVLALFISVGSYISLNLLITKVNDVAEGYALDQEMMSEYQQLTKQKSELEQEILVSESMQTKNKEILQTDIITRLGILLPEDITFQSYSINYAGEIIISGISKTGTSIASFIDNLAMDTTFQKVYLGDMTINDDEEVAFNMTLKINNGRSVESDEASEE